MAQTAKPASRWNSFLAGVESRLDTILTDDESRTTTPKLLESDAPDPLATRQSPIKPSSPARSTSTSSAQNRLNERLAKALAGQTRPKIITETSFGPPLSAAPEIDQGEPASSKAVVLQSLESENSNTPPVHDGEPSNQVVARSGKDSLPGTAPAKSPLLQSSELDQATLSKEINSFNLTSKDGQEAMSQPSASIMEAPVVDTRSATTESKIDSQEEIEGYLERIDALQAKLNYLAKEASAGAKKISQQSKSGSLEQRLANKDERIALLIEEGQKLSQAELKHLTLIKKLRAKSNEDEKGMKTLRASLDRIEKERDNAQEKARELTKAEEKITTSQKTLEQMSSTVRSQETTLAARDALIHDLQSQLAGSPSQPNAAEVNSQEDLERARKENARLGEELGNLKNAHEIAEKEYRTSIRKLEESRISHIERTKIEESKMQSERAALESRLEVLKAQVEQVRAGPQNDMQVHLLRQVETLQNQYTTASENWQGIENNLLARISSLETERDDISTREGELRRRAREAELKCKTLRDELDESRSTLEQFQHESQASAEQALKLGERLTKAEKELQNAMADIATERSIMEEQMNRRIEDEKARLKEDLARGPADNLYAHFRAHTPLIQTRKSSVAADRSHSHTRRQAPDLSLAGASLSSSRTDLRYHHRPYSTSHRSISAQLDLSGGQSSPRLVQQDFRNGPLSPTDTYGEPDRFQSDFEKGLGIDENAPDRFSNPGTPPAERSVHDLVSANTVGAGPSVQLVERMSAAVRRLEADKAANREETARYIQQRDEARSQIVSLMQDNAEKRAVEDKAESLGKELVDVQQRYETTLEMYGEKSERVEELKQDVLDLKQMMRSMVEEKLSSQHGSK